MLDFAPVFTVENWLIFIIFIHDLYRTELILCCSKLIFNAVDKKHFAYVKNYRCFISEREHKFMFAICHRPSVCRLSVVCLSSVVCRL